MVSHINITGRIESQPCVSANEESGWKDETEKTTQIKGSANINPTEVVSQEKKSAPGKIQARSPRATNRPPSHRIANVNGCFPPPLANVRTMGINLLWVRGLLLLLRRRVGRLLLIWRSLLLISLLTRNFLRGSVLLLLLLNRVLLRRVLAIGRARLVRLLGIHWLLLLLLRHRAGRASGGDVGHRRRRGILASLRLAMAEERQN